MRSPPAAALQVELKPQFEMLRDWLQLAKDASRIGQALRRFANAQGFEWFAYLSVHEADVYGMSNDPAEWRSNVWTAIRSSKQYAAPRHLLLVG